MQKREFRTRVKNCTVMLEQKNQGLQSYTVLNLSRGGLCFNANEDEFEINQMIKLNILINDKPIHQANGRVCYCSDLNINHSSAYGLSFLDYFIDNDILKNTE